MRVKERLNEYAQNERQQKSSQNQYHQGLRISDRREAGDYCVSEYWDRIHPEAIEEQKNTLKEKKSALKKTEKEVASLEAKKAKADAKAAEEAKKAEAESVVKRLLASGMSADEILEKLK